MLERMQLFPLNFYKKSMFNGSIGNMNFRLQKITEEDNTLFLGTIWPGPFCYDSTDKEKMAMRKFPFSEEGICEALDWFNQRGKEYNR